MPRTVRLINLPTASSVVGDAAAELADSGSNALTEAGEKLGVGGTV